MIRTDYIAGFLKAARLADKIHKTGGTAATVADELRKQAAQLKYDGRSEASNARMRELASWFGP